MINSVTPIADVPGSGYGKQFKIEGALIMSSLAQTIKNEIRRISRREISLALSKFRGDHIALKKDSPSKKAESRQSRK
jgi:predicted metalloenzyme YecM